MSFRYEPTNDPNGSGLHSRTRALERLLAQHAERGVESIEIRRHMGKSGYVVTRHRWVNDGDGDDLADEQGTILLIGGISPADLAAEIVATIQREVEETGEPKNYRVIAYRNVEDDYTTEPEVAFEFGMPVSMFGPPEERHDSASRDREDTLLDVVQQLGRQYDNQHRMLMDVLRQYPAVLGRCSTLMEQLGVQLGDHLGTERANDLQQVLAVLDFESKREERWMQHEHLKQRRGHRADLLAKSIEIAGPDLVQVIREVIERMKWGPTVDAAATEAESAAPSGSELAAQLDALLVSVSSDGQAKARELLTTDEWRVLESAREAPSDDEFIALFERLRDLFLRRGKEGVQQLERGLLSALGPKAAMGLHRLLGMVEDRKGQ